MMLRLYFRVILISIIFLTAAALLFHMQPYDDSDLRAILEPADCSAPCFMGIRPGVTNITTALQILEASGWMAHYDYSSDSSAVRITWNDRVPPWLINNQASSSMYLWLSQGLVNQVNVQTNMRFGRIVLGMGQPPFQQIAQNRYGDGGRYLFYTAVYPDARLLISVSHNCKQIDRNVSYLDNVILNYAQMNTEASFPSTAHRTWLEVMRTLC